MARKLYLIGLCIILVAGVAVSQSPERRPGELLMQINSEASPKAVFEQLSRMLPESVPSSWEPVVADWQIYRFSFDETLVDPDRIKTAAMRLTDVRSVQWNHKVFERDMNPDDPDWMLQDDMVLIGMPEAWDVTTGGVTFLGDTIVVAILEKGALRDHPDLAPNMWFNWAEIPDNNIDDDGNGYIDDFSGWNPRSGDDNPGIPSFHGTAVNGIVGAKGNNNRGVAGVSWDVKLMNIADVEYEDEIVEAYKYVADMRELYNTTNGAKGAFVVATNASFGIDFQRAEDHPLWCAAYDSLGKVGVLSVGATANQDVNVDIQGDMPSTCPSEYLITVNNVDKFDNKRPNTGYGKVHIDLGAPGEGSYTTRSQGSTPQYGTFDGTSAATPHVTGAIGLLYSLQCPDLVATALTRPDSSALWMRDIILNNVSPNSTLTNFTKTGGRLDVANSVKFVQSACGGAPAGALKIVWAGPNPVHDEMMRLQYQAPLFSNYTIRVFNMLGQQLLEKSVSYSPFSENTWEFDPSTWPAGIYSISFGRNDAWESVKFVKY